MTKKIFSYPALLVMSGALLFSSCSKDFVDPSRATEDKVFSTPAGLAGVSSGLQRVHSLGRASTLYNVVTTTGLLTKELRLLNNGNLPEFQLTTGGSAVDGTNTMVAGLWTSCNKVIYDADQVLANVGVIADKGYAAGVTAYAALMKAHAIGTLSMYWEQVPNGVGQNVSFITRAQGYDKAVEACNVGLAALQGVTLPSSFLTAVPAGISYVDALNALKARFLIANGKNAEALAAANLVNLANRSTFNFEAANPNPIFDTHGSNFNVCQPVDSTMGLPASIAPDLADRRVSFYMALSGVPANRFVMRGFSDAPAKGYPIYLPGEVTLIKAEAYARTNDLTNGLAELNKVVTKTSAADAFGVGAQLPAIAGPLTQAQLLEQIYRNRCVELYMSGLKLEDMRRFGRPNAERTRNFLPYPFRERDNNPNTPPDPAF